MESIFLSEVKNIKFHWQSKFDDQRCFIAKNESVPWRCSEYEIGDDFLPIKWNIIF